MKTPTFDEDGYPSEETLKHINYWYTYYGWTPKEFLEFCEGAFNKNNDLLNDKPFDALRIATGGWSGNESVVFQMEKTVFWTVLWKASVCGGLFILDADRAKA